MKNVVLLFLLIIVKRGESYGEIDLSADLLLVK